MGLHSHQGGRRQGPVLVDAVHDLPVVRHGLGVVHVAGRHFAVIALAVRIGAHAHTDPGRAVPRQMLIERAGQGRFLVV